MSLDTMIETRYSLFFDSPLVRGGLLFEYEPTTDQVLEGLNLEANRLLGTQPDVEEVVEYAKAVRELVGTLARNRVGITREYLDPKTSVVTFEILGTVLAIMEVRQLEYPVYTSPRAARPRAASPRDVVRDLQEQGAYSDPL